MAYKNTFNFVTVVSVTYLTLSFSVSSFKVLKLGYLLISNIFLKMKLLSKYTFFYLQ